MRQGDLKAPGTPEAWGVSSGWKGLGKSATGWGFCETVKAKGLGCCRGVRVEIREKSGRNSGCW